MSNTTTKITYRVRPAHFGYANEDFDNIEQALERANYRNSLRPQQFDKNKFYKGDNCKIQKVTTIIEEITN